MGWPSVRRRPRRSVAMLSLLCVGISDTGLLSDQLPGAAALNAFIADGVAADELRTSSSAALEVLSSSALEDDEAVLTALLSPLFADGFERPRRALTVISDARVHGKAHRKLDDLPRSAEALLSELRSTSSHSALGWYEMLSGGLEAMGALKPPFVQDEAGQRLYTCLLYTSPSPRDRQKSRMPSSA